ncbi:hypothetical protein H310_03375 [Aphanomyces invadans]|uniref:FYVE-type domain-containing protein n=2 Tax=Aphanomyces invadans TaxID=157072 RepID=A0A024UHH2_9STRA|nr:hypothetical protein H310_03375 [Aphanomyces invadans]ETW05650.1 hypothetical protein H310_03375 [Aphanomyces invadans]|eukprot:XP_008865427.1 hypothetical protein H310_03375 [Aphanomyces invadans]
MTQAPVRGLCRASTSSIMFRMPSSPSRTSSSRVSVAKDEPTTLASTSAILQEDLLPPSSWVDKQSRSKCFCCSRQFQTLLRPKYNCRKCGEVVCSKCRVSKLCRQSTTPILSLKHLTTIRICLVCNHSAGPGPSVPRDRQPHIVLASSNAHAALSSNSLAMTPHSPSTPAATSTPPSSKSHASGIFTSPREVILPSPYDLDWDWGHPWPKPPALPSFIESQHMDVLYSLRILDTPKDEVFDRIAIAARRFSSPSCKVACVSFMDLQKDRQWFKASCGLAQAEMPRTVSFCTHTLYLNQPIVVLDARLDERFCYNPLVTGAGQFRFYASVPIVVESVAVGTIFVLDAEPRTDHDVDISKLVKLSQVVSRMLLERRLRFARKASLDESFRVCTTMSVPHFDEDDDYGVATKKEKTVRSYSMDMLDMTTTSAHSPHRMSVSRLSTTNSMTNDLEPEPLRRAVSEEPARPRHDGGRLRHVDVSVPPSTPTSTSDGTSMETMLLTLLNQTTLTQQQIAHQQGDLFERLGSNSTKINMLTEAVARMEAKIQERQAEGEDS